MRTKCINLHTLPTSDHSDWLKSKNVKVNLMMIFLWPCHIALLSEPVWNSSQNNRRDALEYSIWLSSLLVTLFKVTSCEFWGKAQSQVWIRTRNHDVSDHMIQQVKYVLCHYTSSKNSYNEYRYTMPKTAALINKNQLSIILLYLKVLKILHLHFIISSSK